jgi:hypothetical protein
VVDGWKEMQMPEPEERYKYHFIARMPHEPGALHRAAEIIKRINLFSRFTPPQQLERFPQTNMGLWPSPQRSRTALSAVVTALFRS